MALSRHDLLRLLESLRSADGPALVREVAGRLPQELIEVEATARIGAERGEHTDTLTTWWNAHREKTWKKIRPTNPLDRLNREIKRRTDVVQVLPNPLAVLRLAPAVPTELHDEWIAFPRRYLSNESMDTLCTDTLGLVLPVLITPVSTTDREAARASSTGPGRTPLHPGSRQTQR
ncbi:transposase [Streptomyces hirsutus]|uniref:transposase n=1 Tax=Streptomyces hirsutus TaxID=35620 RepID=UPI00368E1EDF